MTHSFARFETISYYAYFDIESDDIAIDDNLNMRIEDATKFLFYLTTVKSTTRRFKDPLPSRPLISDRRTLSKRLQIFPFPVLLLPGRILFARACF